MGPLSITPVTPAGGFGFSIPVTLGSAGPQVLVPKGTGRDPVKLQPLPGTPAAQERSCNTGRRITGRLCCCYIMGAGKNMSGIQQIHWGTSWYL